MAVKPEQEKLDALRAELKDIDKKLVEVPMLERRRCELVGKFYTKGEILKAEIALKDSNYPVYEQN